MGAKSKALKAEAAGEIGHYIANSDIAVWFDTPTGAFNNIGHNMPNNTIKKGASFRVTGTIRNDATTQIQYTHVYLGQVANTWIAVSDLIKATNQKTSSADGYSYDAGSSATSWHYPVIALGVGLGIGFLAGRHFAKK